MDDKLVRLSDVIETIENQRSDGNMWGNENLTLIDAGKIIDELSDIPAVDAVEVVRCRECVRYVESEEANGEKMCVKDADWCVRDGCYYGFTDYPAPDWYCADGKRREEEADE